MKCPPGDIFGFIGRVESESGTRHEAHHTAELSRWCCFQADLHLCWLILQRTGCSRKNVQLDMQPRALLRLQKQARSCNQSGMVPPAEDRPVQQGPLQATFVSKGSLSLDIITV